jgi:delta-aminolevulinic acid dehydratase/porphobilinogen synthase
LAPSKDFSSTNNYKEILILIVAAKRFSIFLGPLRDFSFANKNKTKGKGSHK